jgi:hypothetical protein
MTYTISKYEILKNNSNFVVKQNSRRGLSVSLRKNKRKNKKNRIGFY